LRTLYIKPHHISLIWKSIENEPEHLGV
jgi:hypothetical protein